jgi:hypothetical protein
VSAEVSPPDGHDTIKRAVFQVLEAYDAALSDPEADEDEIDRHIDAAEAVAPHANVSDMIFYGERERTYAEVAEEAAYREQLWRSAGESSLLVHLEEQMESALSDPQRSELERSNAEQALREISARITSLGSESKL